MPHGFPRAAGCRSEKRYPADGFSGPFDAGDELAGLMQNVVDYWQ